MTTPGTRTVRSLYDPSEELQARAQGHFAAVEIYETFVIKRPHPHTLEIQLSDPVRLVAQCLERIQALQGLPGVPNAERGREPGTWVESRAPGVSLQKIGACLTLSELADVIGATMVFVLGAAHRGFRIRRRPQDVYLCRATRQTTQIDMHEPKYDYRSEQMRKHQISMGLPTWHDDRPEFVSRCLWESGIRTLCSQAVDPVHLLQEAPA